MFTRLLIFTFFPFLLLAPTLLVAQEKERPLIISADAWCPFNCSEKDEVKGILVEVVEAAFQTLGQETQYKTLPWKRAKRSLETGQIDVLLGAGEEGKSDQINWDLGFKNEILFMSLKSSPIEKFSRKEIYKYTLGSIKTYDYELRGEDKDIVPNHPKKIEISSLQGTPKLFELLLTGRVEVIVGDYNVFRHYIKKLGYENQFKFIKTGHSFDIGFGFASSETGQQLQSQFKRGLHKIKRSGELDIILKKYDLRSP